MEGVRMEGVENVCRRRPLAPASTPGRDEGAGSADPTPPTLTRDSGSGN